MEIWLDTNIQAHRFIARGYWTDHFALVKEMLPEAEVYVYEEDDTGRIDGFVGLTGGYIAGIFVKKDFQAKGIGKQLLDYVKDTREEISLSVYQKNIRAIRFYQREAFVIQSEGVDESTGEKELVMVWRR